MKSLRYFILGMAALLAVGAFTACSDDDPDKSISVIKDDQTPMNDLDRWLMNNYVSPYNIELRYRWEDNETNMDYILVPPTYQNSIRMARLLKYICFDSFDEVTGSSAFIRTHFPKLVHLVGNPGWNSSGGWMSSGSYTLGSSEGGYKINLWYVNHLSDAVTENWVFKDSVIRDREELNTIFFHTIIHEFGHVFHQKVPYTNEFNQISGTDYLGGMWSSTYSSEDDPEIYARGFISAYAGNSADEDFAEMFAYYVCSTAEEYQAKLDKAGTKGLAALTSKLDILRDYFASSWGLDLDQLRDAVQKREANIANIDFDDISADATTRDYATPTDDADAAADEQ